MASASIFQQQQPPSAVEAHSQSLHSKPEFSVHDAPYESSPSPSTAEPNTTHQTGTTNSHSPSDVAAPSKDSSPHPEVGTPSSLSSEGHRDQESTTLLRRHSEARSSSSSQHSQPSKRKAEVDEDEYIRNDPELYGLRRSRRATQPVRVIESSSEDEDSDVVTNKRPRKRQKSNGSRKSSQHPTPASLSSVSSDEESDTYGSAKARAQTKKNRRLLRAGAGSSTPSLAEVRFSTRRAAQIRNYNEDDDSEEFEDHEMLTPSYDYAAEDNSPQIDAILDHQLDEDASTTNAKKEDYVYRVKWVGRAYYHAEWKTYADLAQLRGAKKIKNYFEKTIQEENRILNDPNISLDEKEQWHLKREEKTDELAGFTVVERVIDVDQTSEEDQYLVKWKGMPYDGSTWESAGLVSDLSQKEIDRYLDRTSSQPSSDRTESNLQTRSPWKPFKEQPSYIVGGQLREFQIRGVNFLAHNWCRGDSVILADEMGLGKTVQTVSFTSWLRHERQQHGPFLIVVPLSTLPAWQETFDFWAPDTNYVVYTGSEASRTLIRDKELFVDGNPRKTKFNVLLTTYEYVTMKNSWTPQMSQIKWQFLAVDEAHRLKNKDSSLYDKLNNLGAPSRLLITGTPVQNNLTELSALMNFLMPGRIQVDEDIDLSSAAASQKINELTEKISPYIIRRTKQKVENDLPPKTEKIIRVALSDVQLELYKNILTRNYTALNQGGHGHKQSLLNIMMELKKASNHPLMFPSVEDRLFTSSSAPAEELKVVTNTSGKMMLLDRLLTKLKKEGHRVLIFSQMVKMLDLLGDYLTGMGYQFQRLDGTIQASARKLAMDHFNADESKDFCFLLSTRAGGLGINLMTADTVILFDSDWNPQADLQAMSRAHRIGQKKPVTVYRFVSRDTVEEEILERARNKLMLEFITIHRGVTDKDTNDLNRKLKAEKEKLEGTPNDPDDINRILRRRGQKMFEQTSNQTSLEQLDIDAVLEGAEEHQTEQPEGLINDGGEDFLKSFQYTDVDIPWDQIIPEEDLKKIKEEERVAQEEEALQELIQQNAPRKRKAPAADDIQEQRVAKKRAIASANDSEDDASDSEADLDPRRPLTEKEFRHLIRAYEKFGHVDDRPDDILKEAKLVGRDMDVVRSTLDEVIAESKRRLRAEQQRLDQLQLTEGKNITKKDKKTVVFDYKGVKRLNAETIVDRQSEMRRLRDATTAVSDFRNFRIPGAKKTTDFSTEWGAREDGMLCVGIARHGHGSWAAIRDDLDLGMSEKVFLEEHQVARKEEREKAADAKQKSARKPGAVHLVRRTAYLFDVLRAATSGSSDSTAQQVLNNHHRNTKKQREPPNRVEKPYRQSASPAPGKSLKVRREIGKSSLQNDSKDRRPSNSLKPSDHRRPEGKRQGSDQSAAAASKDGKLSGAAKDNVRKRPSHHETNDHTSIASKSDRPAVNGERHTENHSKNHTSHERKVSRSDAMNDRTFEKFFDEVRHHIEDMHGASKSSGKEEHERTKILTFTLKSIGNHITRCGHNKPDFETACWDYFAKNYWVSKKTHVNGQRLKNQYLAIVEKAKKTAEKSSKPLEEDKSQKVDEKPANSPRNEQTQTSAST